MDWLALRVVVPSGQRAALADFLAEAGAPAVITEGGAETAVVEAHVPAEDHARLLEALRAYLGDPEAARCETSPLPSVDWEASFRLHHRPVAVGRRLLIAPPWEIPAAVGREVLVIEPGQAFGTGQHATTRACLAEIERAVAAGSIARALDVGTGSGILAMALARLGVPEVVALDCDPAVLPIARANLARNAAGGVALVAGTIACCRGRFDLVVANLLADAIVAAARELGERTAPGGRLVLSGILDDQLDRVAAAFPAWQVHVVDAETEWRTVRLERRC